MHCGYFCPCCSGGVNGENCHAHEIYGDSPWDHEVDGGWGEGKDYRREHADRWTLDYDFTDMGRYDGDPCHLNLSKYLGIPQQIRDEGPLGKRGENYSMIIMRCSRCKKDCYVVENLYNMQKRVQEAYDAAPMYGKTWLRVHPLTSECGGELEDW